AMILFTILVKLDSAGPIFYSQLRVGLDKRRRERRQNAQRRHGGRPVLPGLENGYRVVGERRKQDLFGRTFPVLKFRTMVVDAESAGPQWAMPKDPRITRVGRILRKTHLDELPQLFNILRGDMSFVGPRPERPEFVATLNQEIPSYRQRLALKPGLTGLAQINHRADIVLSDVRRKIRYDMLYMRKASLFTDLKIIFGTVPLMFGLSAEAVRARRWARALRKQTAELKKQGLAPIRLGTQVIPFPTASRNGNGNGTANGNHASTNGHSKTAAAMVNRGLVKIIKLRFFLTLLVALVLASMLLMSCAEPRVRPLGEAAPTPTPNAKTAPNNGEQTATANGAIGAPPESKLGKRVSALIMKSEMRLGPEDIIEVRVKDHPELTAQVPVDPWGFIKLPYVQSLQINGLTEDMVGDILTQKYSEFFRQPPEVEVTVIQYNSQVVYVLGAVDHPGRFPLVKGRPMTLKDVVNAAGLPLPGAALWRTWVIHQAEPGKPAVMRHIDLYRILYRGRNEDNINLQAGDVVYLPYQVLDSIVILIGRVFGPITGVARRAATAATTSGI
ncbi:MAG: sugar transferase, partial [Elusimicrobia bacterium]|nr:sugar transferase [Elusimicrobiota bacterium]